MFRTIYFLLYHTASRYNLRSSDDKPFFSIRGGRSFFVPTKTDLLIQGGVQIDLVTVFDAILTNRQTCEKLQCVYENLMSNNFPKTAVLKKKKTCKLKLQNKGLCLKNFGAYLCLVSEACFRFSIHLSLIFPGTFLQTNVQKIF